MTWQIKFTETADKQLRKLERQVARRIVDWLEERICSTDNPRLWGKALVGDRSGKWRYRIGDYRIVCEILDHALIVRAIKIAHRKEVYD